MRNHRFRRLVAVLLALTVAANGFIRAVDDVPGCASLFALLIPQTASAAEKTEPKKQAQSDTESWQVIYFGKERIGYSHSETKTVLDNGRKVVKSASDTHMLFRRFGQQLKMQVLLETTETEEGQMLSFVQEMKNPPASSNRTVGRVNGEKLVLRTTIASRTTKKELPWDPDVKSPAYQDRLLTKTPLKPGETRSFKTFVPEFNQVATVTVTASQRELVKLLGGKSQKLLKLTIAHSLVPKMSVYVNRKGETLKTETNLLGQVMTFYTVSKEEALKEIAGGELDLAVSTLIKVDPFKKGHRARKVVYRITTPGEDPAEFLVAGETQKIKRISKETVELTVTAAAFPKNSKRVETNPEYLASTEFLQCTDRRVSEHARKATGDETDPAKIALRMERYVHQKLTKKNFSTALASAAEVAENLEGDCTEHAVLLAAMLRAQKIPSRIAVGLVYIERSAEFGGHMWSEAWLGGQWIPLDATLGRGGIGGGHIKLAESSFSDNGPAPITSFLPMMKILGKMKIQTISAE